MFIHFGWFMSIRGFYVGGFELTFIDYPTLSLECSRILYFSAQILQVHVLSSCYWCDFHVDSKTKWVWFQQTPFIFIIHSFKFHISVQWMMIDNDVILLMIEAQTIFRHHMVRWMSENRLFAKCYIDKIYISCASCVSTSIFCKKIVYSVFIQCYQNLL